MSLLSRFSDTHSNDFAKNWRAFLFIGIAMVVLGVVAIVASVFTTLLSVVLLGCILMLSGVMMGLDSMTFWRGKRSGFILHVLFALLYTYVGYIFIRYPVEGSMSLTFLLGLVFILAGLSRAAFFTMYKMPNWGWGLLNGLVSFILGVFILMSWSSASLFVIGLFIGIELLFVGWSYIMSALAARGMVI